MNRWPVAAWEELRDEQSPGVLLLEEDAADKVTAERYGHGWRVVDWELIPNEDESGMHWFARSWHAIPSKFIRVLAAAGEPE